MASTIPSGIFNKSWCQLHFLFIGFFVLNVVVLRIPEYSNCSSFNFQYFTTVIFFTITLKKKKNDIWAENFVQVKLRPQWAKVLKKTQCRAWKEFVYNYSPSNVADVGITVWLKIPLGGSECSCKSHYSRKLGTAIFKGNLTWRRKLGLHANIIRQACWHRIIYRMMIEVIWPNMTIEYIYVMLLWNINYT